MEKIKEFYSHIVGVSFVENSKQLLLALKKDDELLLVPEPQNAFDKNAILIMNSNKEKLGYCPRATAEGLQVDIKAGHILKALVDVVTGGGEKMVGCNILVSVWEEIEGETYSEFLQREGKD